MPREQGDTTALEASIRKAAKKLKKDASVEIKNLLEASNVKGMADLNRDLWGKVYAQNTKCRVEKLHDDGDATIKCKLHANPGQVEKKFVVTTDGEIFSQVEPDFSIKSQRGDQELEAVALLWIEIFGEAKK